MHADKTIDSDWYTTAFDALYPVVYAHRTVEAARAEARFAIDRLALESRDTVLDLCCGNGRHMVHLRGHCARVYGLDYSEYLLQLGREDHALGGQLLRGDMRSLPFAQCFDAVANFFTSFGYFEAQEDNRAVLAEIARVLKPGGRFMLDYLNDEHLVDNLEPESERIVDGYRILEKRWIDGTAARINKNTEIYRGSELVSQAAESVRLYSQEELCAMLRDTGLPPDAFYGDFSGVPAGAAQPRLIVIGRKE